MAQKGGEAIRDRSEALERRQTYYSEEDLARAGAIVSIAYDGALHVDRGLVAKADAKQSRVVKQAEDVLFKARLQSLIIRVGVAFGLKRLPLSGKARLFLGVLVVQWPRAAMNALGIVRILCRTRLRRRPFPAF